MTASFDGHTSYSQVFPQLCKTGLLEAVLSHLPNLSNKRYARFNGLILSPKTRVNSGGREDGEEGGGSPPDTSEPRTE